MIAGQSVRVIASISPINGFTGDVTLSAQGLPAGVSGSFSTNPIRAGLTAEVILQSTMSAAGQTATITVRGASGTLSSEKTLSLRITSVPPAGTFRSSYIRVDGPLFAVAYDPAHKLAFAANPQLNQVEVFSPVTRTRVGIIPVPQAVSLDVTPDGSTLWIGTTGEYLYAVDVGRLEIVDRISLRALGAGQYSTARGLVTTANGSLLLRLGEYGIITLESLVQFIPTTGQLINRSSDAGTVGLRFFRSADGSKVLLPDYGSVTLYDAASDTFLRNTNQAASPLSAIHPQGTQIAVLSGGDLVFLDAQLQVTQRMSGFSSAGVPLYSHDGRFLYLPGDITIVRTSSLLSVIDTQSLAVVGKVADLYFPGQSSSFSDATQYGTTLRAASDTGILMGPSARGFSFVDASLPLALTDPQPVFFFNRPGASDPKQGLVSSGTAVKLSGGNFVSGVSVYFGEAPGAVTLVSPPTNSMQVVSPSLSTPGPVNIAAVFSNGWFALAPEAFSYGPHVACLNLSGDRPQGGSRITIFGLGLDFPANQFRATIGGASATVVDSSMYLTNGAKPSPLFALVLDAPAGTAGPADLTIATPAGSTTLTGAFRYLRRVKDFAISGSFSQILYDRTRRYVYLANQQPSRIEVFSQDSEQFLTPITLGAAPTEMTLTPDASRLLVTHYSNKTISVVSLDSPVQVQSVAAEDPAESRDHRPYHLAATSSNRAFVTYHFPTLSGPSLLRVLDLNTLTLTTRNPGFCCLSTSTLMQSTEDGSRVYFAVQGTSGGHVFYWDAASDSFLGLRNLQDYIDEVALAADGNRWLVDFRILDRENAVEATTSLVDLVADTSPPGVFGKQLHPSGSLLYLPLASGVHIYDLAQARLVRSYGGLSVSTSSLHPLALDATGQTLFAISPTGLQLVELDSVPLSIGHLIPSAGPAAGGTSVTVRGSGFQSGTAVTVGNVPVSPTFADANTLRITMPAMPAGKVNVTVTNPGGERYVLPAAFQYN